MRAGMLSVQNKELWSNYNNSMQELESFERVSDTKKKTIIESIRDCVDSLVSHGQITIQRNQIAIYTWNKLKENGIKYSQSHFYELFGNEQKRDYLQTAIGYNHEHTWQVLTKSKGRRWDVCECGENKLNGIVQMAVVDKDDKTKPVQEIKIPNDKEFELLSVFEEISKNNLRLCKLLKQKASVNLTVRKKNPKGLHSDELEKKHTKQDNIVKSRIEIIKKQLAELDVKAAKGVLVKQLHAFKYFDDRVSISNYQKIMARFAVCIGYDQHTIAKTLGITSKHMRLNVIGEKAGSDQLLADIEWFDRCPNPDCGVVLKDYFDGKIKDYETGSSTVLDDFELILPTGYQRQVLDLKAKLKKLKNS